MSSSTKVKACGRVGGGEKFIGRGLKNRWEVPEKIGESLYQPNLLRVED
jgi:hypothetical protein